MDQVWQLPGLGGLAIHSLAYLIAATDPGLDAMGGQLLHTNRYARLITGHPSLRRLAIVLRVRLAKKVDLLGDSSCQCGPG